MKFVKTIVGLIGALVLLVGCSTALGPSDVNWIAQPAAREAKMPSFEVRVEPQKGEEAFYSSFLLKIENKGDTDLFVDWNRSRYLFNGKPQGMLVFLGLDPEAVRTATVPPDRIVPGAVLDRMVMPLRLIAWSPLKETSTRETGILPGMFPEGENGVQLILRRADNESVVLLSVRIEKK